MTQTQTPSSPQPEPAAPDDHEHDHDRLSALPTPTDPDDEADPLWQELQRRFTWYDHAASRNRLAYQSLKIAFLVITASVTVLAAFAVNAALTAGLAGGLVVIEGIQQLFRFHANWIAYRASAEMLRAHSFAYAMRIDPYDESRNRRSRMATFLRDLILRENSTWARTMKTASPRTSG